MKQPVLQRYFVVITAAITWLVLMMQFYLMLQNRVASVPETIIRFFSFFTILTNILVALYFTVLAMEGSGRLYNFFSRPPVATAVLLYILIVGIVYNTVLRQRWKPEGAQLLVDNILHTVNPVLTLAYWWIYVSVGNIRMNQVLAWLLYPLMYCAYVLFRGNFSGFYPYFFLNVKDLGLKQVIINSLYVTLAFLVVGLLLVLGGRLLKKSTEN